MNEYSLYPLTIQRYMYIIVLYFGMGLFLFTLEALA